LKKYGAEKFVLAADVKEGVVAVHGWLEKSELTCQQLLDQYVPLGVRHLLVTDVSRDGMMGGPAVSLYTDLMQAYPELQLIASGGVSKIADLAELDAAGVPAAVIGRALFEGNISLTDLADFNTSNA
jgi:phosphoribosylformimino-5-aminoimidazole carboxamide ribotide isomerase